MESAGSAGSQPSSLLPDLLQARSSLQSTLRARPRCSCVSLSDFRAFFRRAFGQMAALDPKYEFVFSLGAPTAGNMNAAAGAPILTVDAVHYLQVASGNTLPPAPGAANRFAVPWPLVDIAMLKVHTLNAAVHWTQCSARITNLRACHDAIQRAVAGGAHF